MRVVLATNNAGKLREFRALLAPLGYELEPLSQFTNVVADETGLSFIENAILKARHASQAANLPAIADDSGIEVDVLRGHVAGRLPPGVGDADLEGIGAGLDGLRGGHR